MSLVPKWTKWLAPAAVLFALACALLTPAEAGSVRHPRARAQNGSVQGEKPAEPRDVRGRAVYDDPSRPVRRARILLIADIITGQGQYATLTNADGEFVFGRGGARHPARGRDEPRRGGGARQLTRG